MDLPWGDEKTVQFITNVGLITSNGKHGYNIMACEWTHLISYNPGLIAICIRPGKATYENILKSKKFGVSIASTDQNVLASIAGGSSGKDINKIEALKELGFKFYKAKKINTFMVEGAVLNFECKLIKKLKPGTHVIFIGEIISINFNKEKTPIAYHMGKYGTVVHHISKPSDEEREKFKQVVAKHRKITKA